MAPQPDVELADVIAPVDSKSASEPVKTSLKAHDPFLVEFDQQFDADNPKDWPTGRKWAVTDVLSATAFNRIMVSTIMAPALSTIGHELHMSPTESAMSLSIFLLATAFGPLFIGPLSEIYGRQPVLHGSNVWFLVWNIACGFANSKHLLIGARFLAGFGASSIYALAGGVMADLWRPEQRGRSLAMYILIPILGAAVGPIIGGFMAGRTTWRWMFWSTSIFQAVMTVVSMTVFRETYAPTILKRRAKALREQTKNDAYYTSYERAEEKDSKMLVLRRALTRPLWLLAFDPIAQATSIISGVGYGTLYVFLSSFSELWIKQYHMSVEKSGLHYIACALGEVAGSQIGGPLIDYLYKRQLAKSQGDIQPESRVLLMIPCALLTPIGILIYGWTAQYKVSWIAVDVGMFLTMFTIQLGSLPMQAYIMDIYQNYTSSALSATQFLRSLTAFLFPLFAPSLYSRLGYGWGNTLIAILGLLVNLCAPWVLWAYGARFRAKGSSVR
ncbi:MFS general substrate transporter [Aaosphaeria arxii CBS 175.79]|uniref:MFS general substrate transporter n=1 Tax=Aaosphaeria arxii CBS 175.79 TaxID=1450172 RepID=A0A6A5XIZ4_9PLEO|nr:MFS general substrate transporter [Aaosphaeria arxii CBS 175.79]KAF2012829.1 MFS general substrate transporter [Aaosphaeria arxii CBS 175.79]